MANTFKLKTKLGSNVAANAEQTVYTVPGATTSIIIGLTVANLTSNSVTVDVKINRASLNDVSIGLNLPIPSGGSLDALAGKVVLETTDVITVTCDTLNGIDTALSVMEIT
jgi:hypothetical protein